MSPLLHSILALAAALLLAAEADAQCVSPLADCSGVCTNTQTDNLNCGSCGLACPAGDVCSSGTCALSCQAGLVNCAGICTNTENDRNHCGGCFTACDPGEICSAGSCGLSCQAGLSNCSGTCTNVQTDRQSCGSCGNACGPTEVCQGGSCTDVCVPAAPALPPWAAWLSGAGVLALAAWQLRRRRVPAHLAAGLLLALAIGLAAAGLGWGQLVRDQACEDPLSPQSIALTRLVDAEVSGDALELRAR